MPSLGESSESTSEKVSANLKESAGSKVPSHGTMVGFAQSGTGGELSGVTKTTKNVAVIQPTQVCTYIYVLYLEHSKLYYT